jgi:ketosteroid isomerase-like protein
MSGSEEIDKKSIHDVLKKINESWLQKNYDLMGSYLADNVVMVPPGSSDRIKGKEAYVQSYRDYDAVANTTEFHPGDPQIDVFGDVAVVIYPFFISYDLQGTVYHEHGKEALVLSRSGLGWQILWRTMETEPE